MKSLEKILKKKREKNCQNNVLKYRKCSKMTKKILKI